VILKKATNTLSLPDFKTLCRQPLHFMSLGFGSGLAPLAPGTFGTLAAVPLYLLLAQTPLWIYGPIVALAFVAGVYCCRVTADHLGVDDHPAIVWDEIVGYWLTMIAVPLTWQWLLIGFLLFRFFDTAKPWPIGWVDSHIDGGLGIMLDDVLAAVYAWLCLQLIILTIA
jgi:phosphatidylglycerophosphatase A